ncbi:MAG: TMEM175 family protein [Bacteroidota bacterium]|nr:TMEM175 family protein [Bacteroidota bacterium]
MDNIEQTEIKKEFQLERVILFSDAVFAIIITIMVLDIRLPEDLKNANAKQVQHAFAQLTPKLMAYIISFFLVARFWSHHLKMFSLLKDYDSKLLRFNLLYLFSISLFPFGVSLISNAGKFSPESAQYAWAANIYVSILLLSTLTQTFLIRYLVKNRHKLCFDQNNLDKILKYKAVRLNFYFIPLIVAAMIGIGYLSINRLYVLFTFICYGIVMKRLKKRYYPEKDNNGPILSRLFRNRKLIFAKPQLVREEIDSQ